MKTSVIGFPRIGTLRELKFASEKYFRNEKKHSFCLGERMLFWVYRQRNRGISVFQVMIFHFMILCLTQQYC